MRQRTEFLFDVALLLFFILTGIFALTVDEGAHGIPQHGRTPITEIPPKTFAIVC